MIQLTRLNGSQLVINSDLIETMEATPDTVITLTNDHKWVVREGIDEILERIVTYRRRIHAINPLTNSSASL